MRILLKIMIYIYLIHYGSVKAGAWYFNIYAKVIPQICNYLILIVLEFGGACLIYEMVSRILVLRLCLCGVYEKKELEGKAS